MLLLFPVFFAATATALLYIAETLLEIPRISSPTFKYLLIAGFSLSLLALFFGKDLLLIAANAIRIRELEEPGLHSKLDELISKAAIRKPELFLLPEMAINSCSAESFFGSPFIAISRGALYKLSPAEQQAMLAHEVAHVRNGDSIIYTFSSVLLGGFSIISDWAQRNSYYLLKTGLSKSFFSFLVSIIKLLCCGALLLIFTWITPLIRRLLQLLISKNRDYQADLLACSYLCKPEDLRSALTKANEDKESFVYLNSATEHKFFVNPNLVRREKINQEDSIFFATPCLKSRLQYIK